MTVMDFVPLLASVEERGEGQRQAYTIVRLYLVTHSDTLSDCRTKPSSRLETATRRKQPASPYGTSRRQRAETSSTSSRCSTMSSRRSAFPGGSCCPPYCQQRRNLRTCSSWRRGLAGLPTTASSRSDRKSTRLNSS